MLVLKWFIAVVGDRLCTWLHCYYRSFVVSLTCTFNKSYSALLLFHYSR